MQFAHPSPQQVLTIFGGGFVAEQHLDETDRPLQLSESLIIDKTIRALREAMFEEVMKSMRTMPSI